MYSFWDDFAPITLLIINAALFLWHIYVNCFTVFYFFQLTIISQTLVILNFILFLILQVRKSNHQTRKYLSRLHLVTTSLEAIVVIGFWGLRIFFSKGIVDPNEIRTWEI